MMKGMTEASINKSGEESARGIFKIAIGKIRASVGEEGKKKDTNS